MRAGMRTIVSMGPDAAQGRTGWTPERPPNPGCASAGSVQETRAQHGAGFFDRAAMRPPPAGTTRAFQLPMSDLTFNKIAGAGLAAAFVVAILANVAPLLV